MKFSIGLRLFVAVLLTSLLVAAIGIGMLRESVQRGFNRYVTEIELERLEPLATALEKEFAKRGHWPLQNLAAADATHWLRQQMERLRDQPDARFSRLFNEPELDHRDAPRPPPPEAQAWPRPENQTPEFRGPPPGMRGPPGPPDQFSLRKRIGLLDAGGHLLAGADAAPESPRRALTVNGKTVGYLTLMAAADPSDAISQAFLIAQRRQLLLITLVCVALSAIAALLLATHFRKPIRELVNATGLLTQGRFSTRIDNERSDELGQLADAVNQLAIMLEQHESARRQWVADTSHELRTPVAVLRAQIEALVDGVRQPSPAQFHAMQRQVQSLAKLIDELYELARSDVGELQLRTVLMSPWEVVVQEAEGFRERLIQTGLRLHIEPAEASPELMVDPRRLQQLMANLLENSLRYTDAGGVIELRTSHDDEHWILHMDDSAPGVPDEALSQLGTRFFRVERSRNRALGGSGLGLALCKRIAEAHGGDLSFSHSPLGGLRCTLRLPQRTTSWSPESKPAKAGKQ